MKYESGMKAKKIVFSMLTIIKSAAKIYLANFGTYLKIILPPILGLVLLRLVGTFSYLGNLTIVFSTLMGLVFVVVSLFIEIMLIETSYQFIDVQRVRGHKIVVLEKWRSALKKFPTYLIFKLFLAIITLSFPALLWIVNAYVFNSAISVPALKLVSILWIAIFTFLFLLSPVIQVVEATPAKATLKKAAQLFLKRPVATIITFLIAVAFFGIIFILLATLTNTIIAWASGTSHIFFNKYLTPWWQLLVIDIFTLIGLPLVVIVTTLLYRNLNIRSQPHGT